ncbi:hypothetical protein X797_011465 [Metarhizium robertsii]|uniref:Zn(2)-C6 fungal-type DNA-binding domain protein n=2 Tax=Metarhizium robertsii TaxID=568076 RepID=A0A0B2XF94_METRA|nr:Zn(2)-C6 fungal-type DNA-binding domain protein [Metarhizium robertsii ARSEF 23]EXU95444.1 hypothetical protein X797_011465 [Metarhizium robertsii]KHO10689.1 Zn(2)-C6 fungal-type DNA-binding domain protein [Metarhizium robertsii ARSEF 23]
MVETRKRKSSPVDDRQNNPTKRSRTTVKPKKVVKNLGTCSMDKKQIGDSVKAALALKFDDDTPVVVVDIGHHQAGELLGVSKVKGGNRFATTYLAAMCVVFYPDKGIAKLWVSV